MTALRVRRHIDSDTLRIPELRELIGRDVEIVVREVEEAPTADELEARRRRLYGSLIAYEDPFEPVDVDDWDATE